MDWKDGDYTALLRQFRPRKPSLPPGMVPSRAPRKSLWLAAAAATAAAAIAAVLFLADFHRTSAPGAQPVPDDESVQAGEVVRSNDGGIFDLADGSRVEMRAQSEFSL